MTIKNKIALFGGSFNPPHVGHTLAISYVLSQYNADRILVVPMYRHAFDKNLAPYHHRLEMVRLSVGWLPKVKVSDIEMELWIESSVNRTLDTIKALYERYYDAGIRLVVGSDILYEKEKWHKFDEIEKLAPPIYLGRGGHSHPDASLLTLPDISSTSIRTMIKEGQPTDAVLHPRVYEYIKEHELYGESLNG